MKKRFRIQEPFCGLSHGLGIVLSVAGLVTLLIMAQGRVWHTVGFAIYGVTLITLYTTSTLYHSLFASPRLSDLLQRFDHSAIFLLIAGTYTPVCLVTLHGVWGWSLLGTAYSIAIVGIVLSLLPRSAPHWLRVTLYMVMGWMALIALAPLRAALPAEGMYWLIGGGIIYSIGTVIYATDWPHLWRGRFSAHDLWHVFVLMGSACHFMLMLRCVAPAA